jgi:mannan endo-1,4-beta-mannosidase
MVRAMNRKHVGFVTCAVVVICGAIGVTVGQPWADQQSRTAQSVRYLGVHVADAPASYYGIEQFALRIGTQPNIVSYYSPWGEKFQVPFAASAAEHGAVTIVQMDPMNISLTDIVTGRYDVYLRTYAAAVKAFGGRVLLSFGHEMNGNWYSWGYRHSSPKVFVAAWRHIVDVFRSVGAMNVRWLWTVNVLDQNLPVPIPDPAPWWPGSSYVTWVGIDGYYYGSSTLFSSLFGPTIVAVRHLTADPILIAETGAEVSAGQPQKINDLFDGIRAYGLLGFVWFDENTQGRAWTIKSPQAFAAFRKDARSLYLGLQQP